MKRRTLCIVLAALVCAACAKEETELEQRPAEEVSQEEPSYAQVVVYADDSLVEILEQASAEDKLYTKSMAMNSALDELGIVSYERLFPDAGEYEERTRREGLHRYYIINYDTSVSATKAMDGLAAVAGIERVEKPHRIKKCSLPNDPYFKWQWDLYNDGSINMNVKYGGSTVSSNKGCSINVQEVWDNYTTGSSDVIVSVVDGGVDLSHPDLADVCLAGGSNGSWDFVGNSSTITPDSHGTHVAGTIAAVRNNGIGVAGIAGGDYAAGVSGVKIMSCQIFKGSSGASDAATMRAIKWGADHGAVISQNSWGHYYDTNDDGEISSSELKEASNDEISSYEKAGIDYFVKYAGCDNSGNQLSSSPMKGGLVVFAAGNDNIPYGVPADYDAVIGVGSLGPDWQRAYYSCYGDWVDIAAPGGDGYGSGYASNTDNVGYSRGNIYNLYSTKKDSDYDYTNYGYMMGTSMACPHVSGALALIVSYFGGQGFTAADAKKLLLDGANKEHLNSTYPVGPALDILGSFGQGSPSTVAPDQVQVNSASPVSKTIELSYTVPADSDDGAPKGIVICWGTNKSTISSLDPTSIPSGVSSYTVAVSNDDVSKRKSYTITGLDYATTYYIALFAYDRSKNYSVSSEIQTVAIPENHAPVLSKEIGDQLIYNVGNGVNLYLNSYFSDQDQDPLTYSVTYDNSVVRPVVSDLKLNIKALSLGLGTVTVTATDLGGKTVKATIRVLVKDSSEPAEALPSPVVSDLVIRTEAEAETHVKIVSSTGKVMYDKTSTFSGFDPLVVDMTGYAPGRYSLSISYNGTSYKKQIVKI